MSDASSVDEKLPAPVVEAIGFGAVAYAVGVVLTYVLEGSGRSDLFMQGMQAGSGGTDVGSVTPPSDFELSGMLYHVAHAGIDLGVSASANGQSFSMGIGGDMLEEQYLMAIPALVLICAGYVLARRTRDADREWHWVGASVAVGYVAAMALGALLVFSWTQTAELSTGFQSAQVSYEMGPDLFTSVLAGAGYGVVFGGVGGYLFGETGGSAGEDSGHAGAEPSTGATDPPSTE